jgi:hypothetical protein
VQYTTENLLVNISTAFADRLRAAGYDVFWHTTGSTDAQTAGLPAAKGTVTIVPEIPANPTFITRLKDGDTHADLAPEEIAVPVFTVSIEDLPRKEKRHGIGRGAAFRYVREFEIDGLAADAFQHRELADLLFEWLGEGDVYLTILDYDADPENPPELRPVTVRWADVVKPELPSEDRNLRYYVGAKAGLEYIE